MLLLARYARSAAKPFYELDVSYASQHTFSKRITIKIFGKLFILYQWGLEPRQKNICSRNLRRFKRKLSVKGNEQWKTYSNKVTASHCWHWHSILVVTLE